MFRSVACFGVVVVGMVSCSGERSFDLVPLAKEARAQAAAQELAEARKIMAERTPDWVAKEFGSGAKKFKDPGVYLDGKPVGMLKFGELPVPLEPIWHEEEASLPFVRGDGKPTTKIVRQRRYRFRDYFEALGINLAHIREVHLYGGSKRVSTLAVTGAALRADKKHFTFRFGGDVWGKPIPDCPRGVNGRCPDNVTAVAIYSRRKPPKRVGRSFHLNGKPVNGIPYFGDPLRGGIRVYLDGPLATTIKRNKLTDDALRVDTDGGDEPRWKFFAFLKAQGVDTKRIHEAWVIHNDRRVRRLSRAELENATFVANSQRRGEILFGDAKIPTKALALHTKPISKSDLPVLLPHERDS